MLKWKGPATSTNGMLDHAVYHGTYCAARRKDGGGGRGGGGWDLGGGGPGPGGGSWCASPGLGGGPAAESAFLGPQPREHWRCAQLLAQQMTATASPAH